MTTPKKAQAAAIPAAEQTNEELLARITELEAQLDNCIAERDAAREEARTGRAGYLVKTPSPSYTGSTAGVMFRGGQAFLPATDEGKKKAEFLAIEFGYAVEYVENWQQAPEAEVIGKSLIDALVIPAQR